MVYSLCKTDYIEYNRKVIQTYRVKFNPIESRCQKEYRQLNGESQTCQEIDFDNMMEQLQKDYIDRYEGV